MPNTSKGEGEFATDFFEGKRTIRGGLPRGQAISMGITVRSSGFDERFGFVMDQETMRADADGSLTVFAANHKTGDLKIDRAQRFLARRPIDPHFHVRSHR